MHRLSVLMVGLVDAPWDTIGSRTHVEHAERVIRVIKERLRALEQNVNFRVARRFARWTVYGCVNALNVTRQNTDGISAREAFTGIKADYKRDFRVAFGDYAQVFVATDPSNGPQSRTVGAIALCGTGNSKGSVYWYDLKTEAVFMGDRWTVLPVPDIVLERLNVFADVDDIKHSGKRGVLKSIQDQAKRPTVIPVITLTNTEPSIESIIQLPTQHVPPTNEIDVIDSLMDNATDDTTENYGVDEHNDVTFPSTPQSELPRYSDTSDTYLGSRVNDNGIRQSGRLSDRAREVRDAKIYRLTVKKSIMKYGDVARDALSQEIDQMIKKGVFE